jgi:hypothetical protein
MSIFNAALEQGEDVQECNSIRSLDERITRH